MQAHAKGSRVPFVDDNVRCIWELTIHGEEYYFAYDWCHPLEALKWILAQPEMDCEVDGLDSDAPWGLRVMGRAESLGVRGEGEKIGPFPLDADGEWSGTVEQALALIDDRMVLCSSAWAI